MDNLMIFGAKYLIYLSILLVLFLGTFGTTKEKKALLLIVLAIPIAVVIIKTIHLFFFLPRPFVTFNFTPLIGTAPDASFPSRHATISSIPAFAYLYFKSKWTPLLLLSLAWVGISRVFVGVHYPLDILGGLLVGIISLFIAWQIKKLLKMAFLR